MDYFYEVPDLNSSYYNFFDFNETDVSRQQSMFFIPYLIFFAFGLVANALVLFVILFYRKMKTTTNIYVFSLALSDIFHMLCLLVFAVEIASTYWPLGKCMCTIFWALTAITPFTNVYFLTIMSIDGFIQLYFPEFSKRNLGPKVTVVTSIVVWIACLLLAIPLFMFSDLTQSYNCQIIWPYDNWNLIFISYRLVLDFLLPVLLTCIFLILTAVRFLNQDKSTKPSSGNIKENIILISALVVVYFIFWLPTHILEMMSATVGDLGLYEGTYYTISLIPYLKSCVYPILYGVLSKSFKETFHAVLCCKKVSDSCSQPSETCVKQEEKLSSC